ncbi:MAG: hypothetical protein ABID61_06045, partial [Candidatus Micrarchaeota archaeon]
MTHKQEHLRTVLGSPRFPVKKLIDASSNRRAYTRVVHISRWDHVAQPWVDVASRRDQLPVNQFQTDRAKQEEVYCLTRELLYLPDSKKLAALYAYFPHVAITHKTGLLSHLMQPDSNLPGAIEFDNLRLNGLLPSGVFLVCRDGAWILAKVQSKIDLTPVSGSGLLLHWVNGIKPLGARTSPDDTHGSIHHLGAARGVYAIRNEPRFYVFECDGQDAIVAHELEHCLSYALGSPFKNDEYIAALAEFAYGTRRIEVDISILLHATSTRKDLEEAFRRIASNLLGFFGMKRERELEKITKEELRSAAKTLIDRAYGGA